MQIHSHYIYLGKYQILSYINNKPDYLIALRAIKGESISSDDIDGLINTYRSCLANNGITNENLIRMYH